MDRFVPLHTAEALVLRTYKLGEADRIVVFLTKDRGKKRGVAKGARRQRSRFAGALEPLTEVRVAYFESERRELVGLNYAETVRSPLSLAASAAAASAGAAGATLADDAGTSARIVFVSCGATGAAALGLGGGATGSAIAAPTAMTTAELARNKWPISAGSARNR